MTDLSANNPAYYYVQVGPSPQVLTNVVLDYPRPITISRVGSVLIGKLVEVFGTDPGGQDSDWAVTFVSGATQHTCVRTFRTVEQLVVPAVLAPGHKVWVGVTDSIALFNSLAAVSDVLEQSRASAGIGNYIVETTGSVDLDTYTIDLGASLDTGDNVQLWTLTTE
jgi:hypothetical protein